MGLKQTFYSLTGRKTEAHQMPRQQSAAPPQKPPGGDYQKNPGFVGNVLANIRANVGQPVSSVAELQRRDQAAAAERHRNQVHPILGGGQRTALGAGVTGGPGRLVGGGAVREARSTQVQPRRVVPRMPGE
jgi:hypothetical protein